MEIKLKIKIH